ncbi:Gfo/Idh/MocA family oxidoreductase [Helicobacter ailurogastricus]|uniref:Gfo/Idh/MocA family oxidoreductase n=1 Tax=Helicobacter ailurogastricus TaxID=1578720 RepID=UPI000CF1B9D4|nr:Gfo/Idh/MocA family oxidoreductase [Helicobacter ailurogastricus]
MLFGIIGVGGFIAPKHLRAIYETGHVLDCAVDVHDSVGVLDQYYLDCEFFTSLEDLHQYLQECKAVEKFLDYMVICTPNYLHFEHIEFALNHGINVICEKPLVLDPGEINEIRNLEKKYNKRVFSIMQLRMHPHVIDLKKSVQATFLNEPDKVYNLSLTYLILRGKWYFNSWKGNEERSGGLAFNLCIHFFDMLLDIFGGVVDFAVHVHEHDCIGGSLTLEHANVSWFLSINPAKLGLHRNSSYRSLVLEGQEIDFSTGFEDLHTKSYQEIINGEGFGLEDVRPVLKLAQDISHANLSNPDEGCHPLCHKAACAHHS